MQEIKTWEQMVAADRGRAEKRLTRLRAKGVKKKKRLWVLYALRLENDKYYIGVTTNVGRRFKQHSCGEGARWTALHKPIHIIETRPTGTSNQRTAAIKENLLTAEYIDLYGPENVRGGDYCQIAPSNLYNLPKKVR